MGMHLFRDPDSPGPPYRVLVTVTCDGEHGFFDEPKAETFDCSDCHPRDPAVKAGWKFRDSSAFGPCCA